MTETADDERTKTIATDEETTPEPPRETVLDDGNNDKTDEQGQATAALDDHKTQESGGANGGDEDSDDDSAEAELLVTACEKKFDYACNRETVRMLAHMMTPGDRDRVESWLLKLDESEDEQVRSQYLNFLLTVLASETKLNVEPFRGPPSPGPLRRLGEVVDPTLLFGLALAELPTGPPAQPTTTPTTRETRETFFSRNPVPEDGMFCYAAAFSDIDNEH